MSFILDALRRAETQRGNQPVPAAPDSALHNIAEKPSTMPAPRLIGIVIAGIVALSVIAWKLSDTQQRDAPGPTAAADRANRQVPTPFPTIAPDTPLANVVTPATREVRPLVKEARPPTDSAGAAVPDESARPRITPGTVSYSQEPLSATDMPTRTVTNRPEYTVSLPSYAETVLRSGERMPEFHLDIHVYAAEPGRRFVFVNNRKYREGDQLDEGGTVESITPVGVVLNHLGRRFELVPD